MRYNSGTDTGGIIWNILNDVESEITQLAFLMLRFSAALYWFNMGVERSVQCRD